MISECGAMNVKSQFLYSHLTVFITQKLNIIITKYIIRRDGKNLDLKYSETEIAERFLFASAYCMPYVRPRYNTSYSFMLSEFKYTFYFLFHFDVLTQVLTQIF